MNAPRMMHRVSLVLLAACMCLAASSYAADEPQTVTVSANVVTRRVVGHSAIGAPVEEVTLTHRVSYADLNIATHTGAVALQRRVHEAARLGCRQLARLYPSAEETEVQCIHRAVSDASRGVDEAITAAESKSRPASRGH